MSGEQEQEARETVRCVVVVDDAASASPRADALVERISRLAPANRAALGPGGLPDRLDRLCLQMQAADGPVVVVDGGYVGHDSPLVDVISDPRPGSSVLVGATGRTVAVRTVHGVVVSAASPHHEVGRATDPGGAGAGGVLRVGHDDAPAAVEAVRALARTARDHDWEDTPVLPLLLVALVRHGIRVHSVPLHGFVATVTDAQDDADAARTAARTGDEHRIRLRGAAREADGFYSTFVVRRLSRPVTAAAVRWGCSPNQVTLVALVVAAAAAAAFAVGSRPWLVAGAVLLQVALVVDCVDGEVARYTRQHSALGAWLDAGTDRFKEYGIYAALAVGAARSGDPVWLLAATTLAVQTVRHFVDFGFAVRQSRRLRAATAAPRLPLDQPSDTAHPSPGAVAPPVSATERLGQGATDLSDRTNRVGALVWAKRVVIMPIGERWLVISLAAALSGPRLALLALLVLGSVGALYTTAGRVLRSVVGDVDLGRSSADLALLTDPGPIPNAPLASALGGRFGWLAPAGSRLLEYGAVVAVTTLVAPDLLPLAYALLVVLTVWHYDAVYRLRFTGSGPPRTAQAAAAGAPVRTVAVVGAGFAGVTVLQGCLVLLVVLVLAVAVTDSARGWRAWWLAQRSGFVVPSFRVRSP